MKRVLILSDTHSHLDPSVLKHAQNHDEIWHAGDWGDIGLSDQLNEIRPVRGVYGNIDNAEIRLVHPKVLDFQCENIRVLMTHIGGYPNRYNAEFKSLIISRKPNLVVTGHSHILKVMYDKDLDHLHINPGAMGVHGFHAIKTMISLEIEGNNMRNLKVIELPKTIEA